MGALTSILGRVLGTGPLTRHDRPLWAQARSLQDLADLTARWLSGEIASQPSYYGRVDVDEDDAPGLTDTLIALNRCGFLTENSQAGFDGTGYDGLHWQQHAAVVGFATDRTALWLVDVLSGTRFEVIAHPIKASRWGRRANGVVVTYWAGDPYTTFGPQSTADDVEFLYDGCHADAVDDVCAALMVTVYDPEPGRNDLWEVLATAAGDRLDLAGRGW